MGKASSAKKVARAAGPVASTKRPRSATGRSRSASPPSSSSASLVVFVARDSDQTPSAAAPHRRRPLARRLRHLRLRRVPRPDPARSPRADKLGIHTHGDGIIHIHPFTGGAAGKNATFEMFGEHGRHRRSASNGFTMPDGTEYKDGYDCNGTPATVSVYEWTDADERQHRARRAIYTEDFGEHPLRPTTASPSPSPSCPTAPTSRRRSVADARPRLDRRRQRPQPRPDRPPRPRRHRPRPTATTAPAAIDHRRPRDAP